MADKINTEARKAREENKRRTVQGILAVLPGLSLAVYLTPRLIQEYANQLDRLVNTGFSSNIQRWINPETVEQTYQAVCKDTCSMLEAPSGILMALGLMGIICIQSYRAGKYAFDSGFRPVTLIEKSSQLKRLVDNN